MASCFSSCTYLLVICAVMFAMNSICTVDASGEYQHHLGWLPGGSLVVEEEEFEMDTEINRRILATNRYISYGALQRNSVPCSRRGASYYNCQGSGQANPYQRGCSAITRCRG
ncbi:Rapid ALkalinization Factor [Melia azedarach]|uniref:Rapid ALkalinization Factor n=1 Tax=Melia azedarach TaxID=155640 RepID=A0ACC1Y706_MELAZ|nr:Rapid ALkalinization Factor [Melia azedarach]